MNPTPGRPIGGKKRRRLRGLARERARAGMPRSQLAKLARSSEAAVARWEECTSAPGNGVVEVLARALNCSMEELYRR